MHPDAIQNGVAPWVYWEHEDDSIFFLAKDTDRFMRGFITVVATSTDDPDELARVQAVFVELGAQNDGEAVELDFHAERPNVPWLPPAQDALAEVATYVGMLETDPTTAERGLLGHCHFNNDPDAREALDAHYQQRGLVPPRSFDA